MTAQWDVAVVGAGPGGLAAACAAATGGARTIVLERAEHPRYKTCGGGLIGPSLAIAESRIDVPVRDTITALTFSDRGKRGFRRTAQKPVLTLVRRDDFDFAWYRAAVAAGAHVQQNAQVRAIEQDDDTATVTLASGETISARTVIGAEGSAAISSRHVGVTFDQQDLGLEVELAATEADRVAWRGRVHLDWGAAPGSYGWVFPKMKDCKLHPPGCRSKECLTQDDELTVGVIMRKGQGAQTKQYLATFLDQLGLTGRRVVRDSGHLTRCRAVDAPLRKGRVLVVGDAAGLLEPWTREGISYALRSGTWAGEVAARATTVSELRTYEQRILTELAPEMAAGRTMLDVFERRRALVHAAFATSLGWRAFQEFCRGELSMANVLQRRKIRAALRLFG
ncbi:FAD-dependent monooxygenase [Actinoplanes sp. TFC3]|uniref:FAD-dependent monooxygenase n=1 Tax=Actinoplanes sp. TFC3 TaxID=1710355 RepID=UPI00082CBE9F|nr:FAD-dependent monooxygenase [Actinoplanes sp. TFC3]